jgi:hypothetical protein
MPILTAPRTLLSAGGVLAVAAASGAVLARSGTLGLMMLAAIAFAAFVVVVAERPILGFFTLALILGVVPELSDDDRLVGATSLVYTDLVSGITPLLIVIALVAAVLAVAVDTSRQWWPGRPATLALLLLLVAIANVVWFSPTVRGVFIARPLALLLLALLIAYWTSIRYGTGPPLMALVAAGMLAIPGGLFNAMEGELSYYDASFVYVIGMAAIVVFFEVVDVGFLRLPFLVLSALVIALSFRRGATVAVAIAFLLAALFFRRGSVGKAVTAAIGALIVIELAFPELALTRLETFAGYFSGTEGERAVDAREWESANAWINIEKHWSTGIGPTANWTLYDTAGGRFLPGEDVRHYLHNSYQWVWLRYSPIGLIVFVAFLAVTAFTLMRRWAPPISVIVGGSIIGLAAGLVTGAWLTTTTRWPLAVGLYVGVALAALHQQRAERESGLGSTGLT